MATRGKVVVAMSGGVDSAVAAALLRRRGYECIGVFMRLGNEPEGGANCAVGSASEGGSCAPSSAAVAKGAFLPVSAGAEEAGKSVREKGNSHKQGCCSSSDAADARYVAGLLDIPFYALNFEHDFGGVIDYFIREYNAGRTPNPCVRCNEYLKFGKLARYARAVGADFVATGHYARVVPAEAGGGEAQLLRGKDHAKDQSYVLFGVPRDELARMLLPIGELDKATVRQIAAELKLPVHNKPDSQEICFVPDNDYFQLVKRRSPQTIHNGTLVDSTGKVLGTHPGHQAFTVGQRKGIGVALGYPVYVTKIDPAANTVTLGPKEELMHRSLVAREVNWIAGEPPLEAVRVTAKIRYNSPPQPATALLIGPDELAVRFDAPLPAITAGQAVVCYGDGASYPTDRLLGGAWIERVTD